MWSDCFISNVELVRFFLPYVSVLFLLPTAVFFLSHVEQNESVITLIKKKISGIDLILDFDLFASHLLITAWGTCRTSSSDWFDRSGTRFIDEAEHLLLNISMLQSKCFWSGRSLNIYVHFLLTSTYLHFGVSLLSLTFTLVHLMNFYGGSFKNHSFGFGFISWKYSLK